MPPGTKPTPTAIRQQLNNPQHRALNTREPQYDALTFETVPDELVDEGARAEWVRLAPLLAARGHVTIVDRAAMLGYCTLHGRWQQLEREARLHPSIVRSPSGYPIPSPALAQANRAFALLLKVAAELGLTPSSRSRIIAEGDASGLGPAVDEFTAYQRARRQAG
jgi:P27 family predicted phage terminase small subunit